VKRAGIGVGIAFLLVAVLSIAWPSRSSKDDDSGASLPASGTLAASVYTPFMGAADLTAHDSDPLRMAWIDTYGSAGRWVLFTGIASVLSPPDSPVVVVADVRPGARVLAWGDWGFLLAEPATEGVGAVVRLLGPAGAALAEAEVDR
jgi:hypothetical protein